MLTESQIYDKDGLFHNIVKQSAIMNGRYHVLPNPAHDLNSNNISGIELPREKYPLVGCLTPVSVLDPTVQKGQWEYLSMRLLFLCNTEQTGDHQLKGRDPRTNTSQHRISHDWADMKAVALSFMNALEQTQDRLRGTFQLDERTQWRIHRISRIGNDQVSGVLLTFTALLACVCGSFSDISAAKINAIQLPTVNHQPHFH